MLVNREWHEAVATMPPINAFCTIRNGAQLKRLLRGSLRRHVSGLLRPQCPESDLSDDPPLFPLTRASLHRVSLALPCLRIVRIDACYDPWTEVNGTDVLCQCLPRFTRLTHLYISVKIDTFLVLSIDPGFLSQCHRVMEAAARLPSVTVLKLCLPDVLEQSFAALKAMPRLRVFSMFWHAPDDDDYNYLRPLSDEQIADLCALQSVEQMTLPFANGRNTNRRLSLHPTELCRFCPPGSMRPWSDLGFMPFTPATASCLSALPRITSLAICRDSSAIPHLAQLTRLTDLTLQGSSSQPVDADQLTRALKACAQITRLHLADVAFSSRQLEELLRRFPLLFRLALSRVQRLESTLLRHSRPGRVIEGGHAPWACGLFLRRACAFDGPALIALFGCWPL